MKTQSSKKSLPDQWPQYACKWTVKPSGFWCNNHSECLQHMHAQILKAKTQLRLRQISIKSTSVYLLGQPSQTQRSGAQSSVWPYGRSVQGRALVRSWRTVRVSPPSPQGEWGTWHHSYPPCSEPWSLWTEPAWVKRVDSRCLVSWCLKADMANCCGLYNRVMSERRVC